MTLSWRRIRAITRKELRDYVRNRSVLVAVAIFPLIFLIQPVVLVLKLPTDVAVQLSHRHLLLYMLAVPILAPGILGAYSVAGERQQESLEPALTTPIRSRLSSRMSAKKQYMPQKSNTWVRKVMDAW